MRLKKAMMSAAALLMVVSASQAQFDIPSRLGLVNDFAAKLTDEEKKSIDSRLRDFAVRHQMELAVVTVTVDRLKGRPVEEYSRQLANRWGIGAGVGKFGLLLLVAIGKPDAQGVYSGSTRLEVSRRLEADITNEAAREIIRQMRTDLRAGRFSDALQRGIDGTDRALAKKLDQPTPAQTTEKSSGWFSKVVMALLAVTLFFVAPIALLLSLFVWRRNKAYQNISTSSRAFKPQSQ
ncbi:MAG TPA: TPM domain-containing protein, partial [Blastocatellia bacterium]